MQEEKEMKEQERRWTRRMRGDAKEGDAGGERGDAGGREGAGDAGEGGEERRDAGGEGDIGGDAGGGGGGAVWGGSIVHAEWEKIKTSQDIQERNENKLKGKMLEKEF